MDLFSTGQPGYFIGLLLLCAALVGLFSLWSSKASRDPSAPSHTAQRR